MGRRRWSGEEGEAKESLGVAEVEVEVVLERERDGLKKHEEIDIAGC